MRKTVIESHEQAIANLANVLTYLDAVQLQVPAAHVSMAIDTMRLELNDGREPADDL
jgi:hypothetical protein